MQYLVPRGQQKYKKFGALTVKIYYYIIYDKNECLVLILI